MRAVLLLATLLGACSSLSDVDSNTCGNGILEAGEDCDASDPRCVACGIRCDMGVGDDGDAQCAAYPGAEGFVCGADDFCHAPSGRFRPATELSTSVETYRGTDINRDGYGDIIVQSATGIRVLFGNADGHPTTSQQVVTPIARGAAHYADLDLDSAGKLDILLPAADGIVAYTSPFDVLSPFPFPSIVSTASEGRPYYSHAISDGIIGFVGTAPGAGTGSPVSLFIRDVSDGGSQGFVAAAPLCGATDQSFEPHDVSVFDVRLDYQLFAATFRQGATMKLCLLAIEKVGANWTVTDLPVNLGAGRTPASRAVLAPIGPGACPSLVLREQVGAQNGDVIAVAGTGTTTCSYSGVPSVRPLSSNFGDPVGWAPLVPADPSTNATVALALTVGVFAVPATGPLTKMLYVADRPLSSIQSTDLDKDGDIDIIASSATLGEIVEDIDLLSRFSMGFVRYRFDTDGPVDLLTIGDYDGNGIPDVAYVQTRVISGVTRYDLLIAYATGDQLLPGVNVGTYGNIISLLVGDIPDSNDPFGVVNDLVVLFQDADQTAITLLHGSPQRTMLGFFDPSTSQPPAIFRGIVSGHFNDAPGPVGLDMIAIDEGDLGAPNIWRSNGPTGGEVEALTPHTVSLLGDCTKASPATSLCVGSAFYVAWPMAAGRDRVIGLGQNRAGEARVITFDPHATTVMLPAQAWPSLQELPVRARIRAAEVVTLAGTPRLLLAFSHLFVNHLLLCTLDRETGIPTGCVDLGGQISSQLGIEMACTHATTARIRPVTRFMKTPPIAEDLVAVCHEKANPGATNIYQFRDDLQAIELLHGVSSAREVRVGDVDGNGIADFLTVDRETAVPTLRIYRQCTAREVATCGL